MYRNATLLLMHKYQNTKLIRSIELSQIQPTNKNSFIHLGENNARDRKTGKGGKDSYISIYGEHYSSYDLICRDILFTA